MRLENSETRIKLECRDLTIQIPKPIITTPPTITASTDPPVMLPGTIGVIAGVCAAVCFILFIAIKGRHIGRLIKEKNTHKELDKRII